MLRNTNEKPLAGFSGTCHAKRHHRTAYTHCVRADDECIGARRRLCMPLFEWKLLRFQQSNANKNRKTIGVRSRIISITWKQFYTLSPQEWARNMSGENDQVPVLRMKFFPVFSLNFISFICLLINERAWAPQISANFAWGRDENEEKFDEKKKKKKRKSLSSEWKKVLKQPNRFNKFIHKFSSSSISSSISLLRMKRKRSTGFFFCLLLIIFSVLLRYWALVFPKNRHICVIRMAILLTTTSANLSVRCEILTPSRREVSRQMRKKKSYQLAWALIHWIVLLCVASMLHSAKKWHLIADQCGFCYWAARCTNYVTILFNIFCGHKLIKLNEWHLFQLHSFLFHLSPGKYNRSLSFLIRHRWMKPVNVHWVRLLLLLFLFIAKNISHMQMTWLIRTKLWQTNASHWAPSHNRSFVCIIIIIIGVATTIDCMCRISNGFELIATWTKFNENAVNVWRDTAIWREKKIELRRVRVKSIYWKLTHQQRIIDLLA